MKIKTKLNVQLNFVRATFLITALYAFMMATSFATIAPDILSVPTSKWFTLGAVKPILLLSIFGYSFLFLLYVNHLTSKRAERLRKVLKVEKSFLRI